MTVLAIDGNYALHRFVAASPFDAARDYVEHVRLLALRFRPSTIWLCWDSDRTWRRDQYPWYKANRKVRTPEEQAALRNVANEVSSLLTHLGVRIASVDGFEGDDLLFEVVIANHDKGEVVVVTEDKDLLQLTRYDTVRVYKPRKDKVYSRLEVEDEFGLPPHLIPLYIAVVGDSSDGIKGVRGIGPKRADKLFSALSPTSVDEFLRGCEQNMNDKLCATVMSEVHDLYEGMAVSLLGAVRVALPVAPASFDIAKAKQVAMSISSCAYLAATLESWAIPFSRMFETN